MADHPTTTPSSPQAAEPPDRPAGPGVAVRWALALGSVAAAPGGVLLVAVQATALLDRLCPPAMMVSGLCTAPWYPAAELGAYTLAAALGGWAIVAWPAALAPRARRAVAALAAGLALAITASGWWHAGSTLLWPGLAALLGAAIALRRAAGGAAAGSGG